MIIFEHCKFKIISMEQDFIFPYKLKQYKNNRYVKIDYFKKMHKKIFRALQRNIGEYFLLKLKKI